MIDVDVNPERSWRRRLRHSVKRGSLEFMKEAFRGRVNVKLQDVQKTVAESFAWDMYSGLSDRLRMLVKNRQPRISY